MSPGSSADHSLPMQRRGYVICTDPRSGSSLLCRALRSTGILGQPREYLGSPAYRRSIEKDADKLEALIGEASTPNGVYGLKVFTHDFDNSRKSRWPSRLPNLHFVYLERRDVLGQAISLVRADQTGQYHSGDDTGSSARYDAARIARAIRRITANQQRWRSYFARNGIEPLWLVYEDFSGDLDLVVARIAEYIGLDAVPRVRSEEVRLNVQRDAISSEWRSRFIAERGNPDYLDHPRPWRVSLRRLARGPLRPLGRLAGRWLPA